MPLNLRELTLPSLPLSLFSFFTYCPSLLRSLPATLHPRASFFPSFVFFCSSYTLLSPHSSSRSYPSLRPHPFLFPLPSSLFSSSRLVQYSVSSASPFSSLLLRADPPFLHFQLSAVATLFPRVLNILFVFYCIYLKLMTAFYIFLIFAFQVCKGCPGLVIVLALFPLYQFLRAAPPGQGKNPDE